MAGTAVFFRPRKKKQKIKNGRPTDPTAGWPTPDSQQTIYVDRTRCLSQERGYLKSRLFLHAASSGGPALNARGELIGIASFDVHAHHKVEYESWFRSVGLLRPEHGLPMELCPSGAAAIAAIEEVSRRRAGRCRRPAPRRPAAATTAAPPRPPKSRRSYSARCSAAAVLRRPAPRRARAR